MRTRLALLLATLLLLSLAHAAADRDILYQVSTLDALLAGVYDPATTAATLARHGDIGLGCFAALDGEMMMLDGRMYQIRADGSVHRATPSMGLPFAAVTFFDPDRTADLADLDLPGLVARVDALLPSRNIFHVFRLEGDFEYVKTRSVPRQHKPYPRLADVAAQQPTFEFANTRGSLVGLYCPYFTAGANLPGYHFHFLNADRTGGGHLLNLRLKTGTLQIDHTPGYRLDLPDGPYRRVKLDQADKEGAEKVEKDR